MKKEYELKKMKWSARKPKDAKELKVAKTFRIDADLFLWLKQESERTGIPYQTLMNSKLREAMSLPDRVRELVREELRKTGSD